MATYYDEFSRELYRLSKDQIPVCCVSHAGHVTLPTKVAKKAGEVLYLVDFVHL